MRSQTFVCGGGGKLTPAAKQELRDYTFFLKRGGKRILGDFKLWRSRLAECPGCYGATRIESDDAPGTFYPCSTCNHDWQRVPFGRAAPDTREEPNG